ncbi:thiamine phosphate synthase [Cypionkella psychrotolerans]|uniref:thiamine phosphate synthase n=1 Tax=Cypionkella psychrotolerans TaxID=1678131 RepID=UPI0006B41DD4|nr:thiamine phosphate synthase [Cypionkella psychrotolerans]
MDRFYLILPDATMLAALVPLGARLVQLRLKSDDVAEVRRQVAQSLEICAKHGTQLVVNDHWQTAIDLGADAVHLGQEDLDTADLPALRRAGVAIGMSTHDEAELERALSLSPAYVALGPIYPTLLKQMPWQPQGLEKLTRWKTWISALPLVAIGGLTLPRLPGVFAAGADSAAVVTDIVTAQDPVAQTQTWLRATR